MSGFNKDDRLRNDALDKLTTFVSAYSDMEEEKLRQLVDHIPVQMFHKGRTIIEQGTAPKQCFFILEGCARKYSVNEEGKEVTSDFYTENQSITIFSEEAGYGSPYSVTCLEDSVMIVGEIEEQASEMDRYPELEKIVLKLMGSGMGELQDTFAAFIRMTPEERVKFMMGKRPELFERVPQHQLASYLGITPESLSRIKGRLGQGHLKAVD